MNHVEQRGPLGAALLRAGLAGLVLAISACAPITPSFDQHFGQSVPALRAQQVANPQAGLENQERTVTGMDGRAAREAVDRYYKSFREPPPPSNTFNIGVGAGQQADGQ